MVLAVDEESFDSSEDGHMKMIVEQRQDLIVGGRMSTGLMAVVTAMAMCEHVDVYGFGLGMSREQFDRWQRLRQDSNETSETCDRTQVYARYHHLDDLASIRCRWLNDHDFTAEHRLLDALHARGFLNLVKMSVLT